MGQFLEFALNNWMLFAALLIVAAALFWNLFGNRIRGINDIAPVAAVRLINHEDAVVLDVRDAGEIKEGMIRDAVHIPLAKLKERSGELEAHRQRPVLVVCRSGNRSALGGGTLRKAGFEKVYNLAGGMNGWLSANLPVSKPASERKERKERKKKEAK